MAFGRRKSEARVDADVAATEVHHRSMRRRVLGYLVILIVVFVGVMLALAIIQPTQTTVK